MVGRSSTVRILFAACLVLALMAVQAGAANQRGELTLRYTQGSTALSGVAFSLYFVGEVQPDGTVLPQGDFARCPGAGEGEAGTLADFAWQQGLVPQGAGTTNAAGVLTFSSLTPGRYLVTGTPVSREGVLYLPQPLVVTVTAGERLSCAVSGETGESDGSTVPEDGPLDLLGVARTVLAPLTQKRSHRGLVVGLGLFVAFGAGLYLLWRRER